MTHDVRKKGHGGEARVVGAIAATHIRIRVVPSLMDRFSIPSRLGIVTSIVVSLRGSIILHARRGNIGPDNRGCAAKRRSRATRGLHNDLWD